MAAGMYGIDPHDDLYQINTTTGVATRIGPTGLPDISFSLAGNSLAGDATTLYYTLGTRDFDGNDVLPSRLYTLNLSTGAATTIGSNELPPGQTFIGSGFIDNTLYAFRNTFDPTSSEFYTVNMATGAATFVTNTPQAIYGAAPIVPAPAISGTIVLQGLAPTATPQTVTFTFRDAGGAFSFPAPEGNYTLHLSAPRYLARNVSLSVNGSGAALQAALSGGDANGDNAADALDLAELINAFNTAQGIDAGYDAATDFNGDSSVDVLDLAILIDNFNSEGDA